MPAEKRIGILTSGGDCAGLNACIRAVVHHAVITYNWTVLGIAEGTRGLLSRPVRYQNLTLDMVQPQMMRQGGTILGTTNQGDPTAFPMPDGSKRDRSAEIAGGYRELGLDALIGIGGDGSLAILRRLAIAGGFPLVGVPKTIDNDVGSTEVAVGFDTAVAIATEALDRLQPTAASHHRVMVLEVMGRDAGHIALSAGISGGADVILIPEIPYSLDKVAEKIRDLRRGNRNFALVVVSEAIHSSDGQSVMRDFEDGQRRYGGIGDFIGHKIAEATGSQTRVTVLGHVQRGGMPSARDRLIASAFGVHAVDLIAEGKFDRMVAWQNRQVVDVPLEEAISTYQAVDPMGPLVRTARALGISMGD